MNDEIIHKTITTKSGLTLGDYSENNNLIIIEYLICMYYFLLKDQCLD